MNAKCTEKGNFVVPFLHWDLLLSIIITTFSVLPHFFSSHRHINVPIVYISSLWRFYINTLHMVSDGIFVARGKRLY